MFCQVVYVHQGLKVKISICILKNELNQKQITRLNESIKMQWKAELKWKRNQILYHQLIMCIKTPFFL